MGSKVLVIDDERGIRWVVQQELTREGHEVVTAKDGKDALKKLSETSPDVALVDLCMPVMDGFAFMEEARYIDPDIPMIAMSGCGTVDDAVRIMRLGASDLIQKPFAIERLSDSIQKALTERRSGSAQPACDSGRSVLNRSAGTFKQPSPEHLGGVIIGQNRKMREIFKTVKRIARSSSTSVFIQGESGTGKELIARAIHFTSSRRDKRFTAINCAALTETLLESELFGYEKGAFTGAATTGKPGLFEVTDGGTMFLDEIAEMSVELQSKLLRVLQERMFKRVGGLKDIPVDLRIIASTNRDLRKAVRSGSFREDLFYRLNVVPILVPPLRERADDIPLLVNHFLRQYSEAFGRSEIDGISPEATEEILAYDWPGNVRELQNVIERAVLLETSSTITTRYLMLHGHRARAASSETLELADRSVSTMERQLIKKVLEENLWQRTEAAKVLGIHRTTLANKIKEYGLDKKETSGSRLQTSGMPSAASARSLRSGA